MSQDLAETRSALPAQAYNPSQELTSEDIPTPRVKFAQGLSEVVTGGLVPYGAIYSVVGQGDPSPSVLAEPAKSAGEQGPGVRFYVFSVRKGYSFSNTQNDLDNTRDGSYPDLSLVKNQDPREVYRTFDYTIALPDHDGMLPYKLMLYKKWGGQAAKRINLSLLQAQANGKDPATECFSLRAKKDKSDKGSFATAIVDVDKVPAVQALKDIEVLETVRQFVAPAQVQQAAPVSSPDAPALD